MGLELVKGLVAVGVTDWGWVMVVVEFEGLSKPATAARERWSGRRNMSVFARAGEEMVETCCRRDVA